MKSELITILLGFLEGFALILSPCILSILPIILASSLVGSKRRPLGIITGFTLTFAIFAFFARQFVQYTDIDLTLIRHSAYGLLFLLGVVLMSNSLTEKFNQLTQRLTALSSFVASSRPPKNGFFSGLLIGGLVAVIWTPCAGPILAAIIVQIVIQKTNIMGFLTLLSFALGAAIPMLIISLYGLKIKATFGFFKTRAIFFRKILGAVIIINLGYMIYQETGFATSTISQQSPIRTAHYLEKGLWHPYPAPKIEGINLWINSPHLKLSDLKGKVVLVDFWTYSCINCIRTSAYLKKWYSSYHDKGLVIIGVHSPEFDFEKNPDNVKSAVKRYEIQYPVALDNQFVTWLNFSNHNWPAHYLINKQGDVVYEHLGEGAYDVTENNIRYLLKIDDMTTMPVAETNAQYSIFETPETYLGYARADTDLSPVLIHDQVAQYQFPTKLKSNAWSLHGAWQVNSDKLISKEANAALSINFNACKVFMVMGTNTEKPIHLKLLLNGKPLKTDNGKDIVNSHMVVNKHALYELMDLKQFGSGILQIITNEPGLEIYTVTFGS